MNIIEITNGGISTTNRDTIFNNLMQEFKNLYGANAYVEKGTEDYNMISLLADLLSDMGNVAVSASNALSLTNAVGVQLDNLASIYYGTFSRKPATYSTVKVNIMGEANTRIVNGQVRDGLGGVWNLETPITIPAGGILTDVVATYTEPGAYYISANKISGANSIATPVAGWNNVTQPAECNIGQDVETDASFRARIAQRSKGTAVGTLNSLQSNLLAMIFEGTTPIKNVRIYENDTASASEVVSGLTIPAHTIAPIIFSDTAIVVDNDLSVAIAETIYAYKASGVGTYGSINQDITNSQSQTITINFTPADPQPLKFNIELRKLTVNAPDLTDSAKAVIQNAVKTQLSTYGIGDTVYSQDFYYPVTTAISQALDLTQYNISNITISSDNGSTYTASAVLNYDQIAVIENASSDIDVSAT